MGSHDLLVETLFKIFVDISSKILISSRVLYLNK